MGTFVKDHKKYTYDGVVTINDNDEFVTKLFIGLLIIVVVAVIVAAILGGS